MILTKKEVGQLVKKARKHKSKVIGRKYTCEMLAKDIQYSRSYIGDIESGRTYPNYILINKIAEACGVSFSFFEGQAQEQKKGGYTMDYKKVLENQIQRIEEVQERALKELTIEEENLEDTKTTLSLITDMSARIESLILSIKRLERVQIITDEIVTNRDKKVAEQEVRVQVQPIKNVKFVNDIAKSIAKNIINCTTHDTL